MHHSISQLDSMMQLEAMGSLRLVTTLRLCARKYPQIFECACFSPPKLHQERWIATSTFEDVAVQDSLFRYVVRSIFGEQPTHDDKPEMLGGLRDAGVFLMDLKGGSAGRPVFASHVPDLVFRVVRLQPRSVILIKATVYCAAFSASHHQELPRGQRTDSLFQGTANRGGLNWLWLERSRRLDSADGSLDCGLDVTERNPQGSTRPVDLQV